jgi:hypothetical protein
MCCHEKTSVIVGALASAFSASAWTSFALVVSDTSLFAAEVFSSSVAAAAALIVRPLAPRLKSVIEVSVEKSVLISVKKNNANMNAAPKATTIP